MKNLYLSIALFISATYLTAQDKKTFVGWKGGITLPGTIHGGGLLGHPFNKNFAYVGEILFNQKITNIDTIAFIDPNGVLYEKQDVEYKMNYIQIPLSLKATFGNKVKPYAMAGFAIAYLMSSSIKAKGRPLSPIIRNSLEWSYLASFGIDYRPLFIELRYNYGLNAAVRANNSLKWKEYSNSSLMISVGFKL